MGIVINPTVWDSLLSLHQVSDIGRATDINHTRTAGEQAFALPANASAAPHRGMTHAHSQPFLHTEWD